ncbi:hypothetical protein VNO78_24213 [Psophocarpus tetragonolobus]|uniref:Uncharacterized protein n=1 Tax=Psophocarpus tetragonolobus TaxID=3891 RepID=A0AAN9S4F6_PSOTE
MAKFGDSLLGEIAMGLEASGEQFIWVLVTEVLKIGVSIGAKKWTLCMGDDGVKWEAIVKAVKMVLAGEEIKEMRKRVKAFAQMARQAIEEGGSSDLSLNALIEELGCLSHS